MDVAGLDELRRQELRRAHTIEGDTEVWSFLELMDTQPPQERARVDHDRSVFEGAIAQGRYETKTFTDGVRRLRVWTVDKGAIEKFTGVDLVILNLDFNSLLCETAGLAPAASAMSTTERSRA